MIEPGCRRVTGLVQADRRQPLFFPALMDSGLERVEGEQPGLALCLRRADFAARRSALGLPLLAQHFPQRFHEEDHPPGAAGLSTGLVTGELSSTDVEVEMFPIEDLDLLVSGAAVAGKCEGESVFARSVAIAG